MSSLLDQMLQPWLLAQAISEGNLREYEKRENLDQITEEHLRGLVRRLEDGLVEMAEMQSRFAHGSENWEKIEKLITSLADQKRRANAVLTKPRENQEQEAEIGS